MEYWEYFHCKGKRNKHDVNNILFTLQTGLWTHFDTQMVPFKDVVKFKTFKVKLETRNCLPSRLIIKCIFIIIISNRSMWMKSCIPFFFASWRHWRKCWAWNGIIFYESVFACTNKLIKITICSLFQNGRRWYYVVVFVFGCFYAYLKWSKGRRIGIRRCLRTPICPLLSPLISLLADCHSPAWIRPQSAEWRLLPFLYKMLYKTKTGIRLDDFALMTRGEGIADQTPLEFQFPQRREGGGWQLSNNKKVL